MSLTLEQLAELDAAALVAALAELGKELGIEISVTDEIAEDPEALQTLYVEHLTVSTDAATEEKAKAPAAANPTGKDVVMLVSCRFVDGKDKCFGAKGDLVTVSTKKFADQLIKEGLAKKPG